MSDSRKQAARPIPMDRQELERLYRDVARRLPVLFGGSPKPEDHPKPRAYFEVEIELEHPRFEIEIEIPVRVQTSTEARSEGLVGGLITGSYFRDHGGPVGLVVLFLHTDLTYSQLRANDRAWQTVLKHELTHVLDSYANDPEYINMVGEARQKAYYNEPIEVRAMMAQAVEQAYDTYASLRDRYPHAVAMRGSLDVVEMYDEMRLYMTKRNHQTFLKGFERGLRDRYQSEHREAHMQRRANEPTNPELWNKVQDLVKGKRKSLTHNGKTVEGPNDGKGFKKFPSAYANGFAVKTYNDLGGNWKASSQRVPKMAKAFDEKDLKNLKSQFKVLTKIYRDIPVEQNGRSLMFGPEDAKQKALKQAEQAQRVFETFSRNITSWVRQGINAVGMASSSGTARDLIRATSDLTDALSSEELFPIYYNEGVINLSQLGQNRDKAVRAYQKAWREFYQWVESLMTTQGGTLEQYEPVKFYTIKGVKIKVDYTHLVESQKKHMRLRSDLEAGEKEVDYFLKGFKKSLDMIDKVGLSKAYKGVTVNLTFHPKASSLGHGELAGTYRANGDELLIYPPGMTNKGDNGILRTLVHELGHRFYYRAMSPNARSFYVDMLSKATLKLERVHIERYMDLILYGRNDKPRDERAQLQAWEQIRDQIGMAMASALRWLITKSPEFRYIPNESELRRELFSWVGKTIPFEHITDYGNSSPVEAYAESFTLYVMKGPRALQRWTRELFERVSHQGKTADMKMHRYEYGQRTWASQIERAIRDLVKAQEHLDSRRAHEVLGGLRRDLEVLTKLAETLPGFVKLDTVVEAQTLVKFARQYATPDQLGLLSPIVEVLQELLKSKLSDEMYTLDYTSLPDIPDPKTAAKPGPDPDKGDGLNTWFSGHGKEKGDAAMGDWVAIAPKKKKIEVDGKGKTVYPGDIIGPCGEPEGDWSKETNKGQDPLKCMPRAKAQGMSKSERADLAKEKMRAEKKDPNTGKKPTYTPTLKKDAMNHTTKRMYQDLVGLVDRAERAYVDTDMARMKKHLKDADRLFYDIYEELGALSLTDLKRMYGRDTYAEMSMIEFRMDELKSLLKTYPRGHDEYVFRNNHRL